MRTRIVFSIGADACLIDRSCHGVQLLGTEVRPHTESWCHPYAAHPIVERALGEVLPHEASERW